MLRTMGIGVGVAVAGCACALAADTAPVARDGRLFEMRTYYAAPGKLDALQARFRDHTCALFASHGMANIGYWVPLENPERKLVYVLAFKDAAAHKQAWKDFLADPAWKAAQSASEQNGRLVERSESVLLTATDFSPVVAVGGGEAPRVFELRTYKAAPGRLPNLLARFRDHTVALFTKHGISQIGYWTPVGAGAEDKLIYILAHKSREACQASFAAFRADPAWVAARKASEALAGGSLTVTNGVNSVLMSPTDFSPLK